MADSNTSNSSNSSSSSSSGSQGQDGAGSGIWILVRNISNAGGRK